jgi:hypothetical protein
MFILSFVGYIMWLKDPDNKLKDIRPLPFSPSSPLAKGASKKHWEVARYMLSQVSAGVIGVNETSGATYDKEYFVPQKKKLLLPEEYKYYELRAASQDVARRFYELDIADTPDWEFLPKPSIEATSSFSQSSRAARQAAEDAIVAEVQRIADVSLVRPSSRFQPGEEILSRDGRSANDEVGPLDLTKLSQSIGNKGYKVAELRNYCLIDGLQISGSKEKLRERLMIAKGLIPARANGAIASASGNRANQRGSGRLSPNSRREWANGVIQDVVTRSSTLESRDADDSSEYESIESDAQEEIPQEEIPVQPAVQTLARNRRRPASSANSTRKRRRGNGNSN